MTANIFGQRFLGRREPAWHSCGTVFDEPYSATQAMEIAGLNFEVHAVPLFADYHGVRIPLDKVAIVRDPTADDPQPRVFGLAGTNYEILQNLDIAAILDPLTDLWPVETVGALGLGEKIFVTLDVGASDVNGDPIREYFLLTEGKTGGDSVTVAYTPVRVVCQNTLTLGLSSATIRSAITHTTGARAALKFRVDIMSALRLARRTGHESLVAMANTSVDDADVEDILLSAYPQPKQSAKARLAEAIANSVDLDPAVDSILAEGPGRDLLSATALHNYVVGRVDIIRDAARDRFEVFNDEFPTHAYTGWAVYNAVVETEDYRSGGKGAEVSALFGPRAATKERAFRAVMEFCR